MKFKKYNSIENSYQDSFIKSIDEQGFGDLQYVVQEKVHGANISFMTDGENIISAKRTELISDNEDFYNSKNVLEKYKERILALFHEIATEFQAKEITIFGEIFGGGYPHPSVVKEDKATLVQRGIYYCPQNEFYAFDILIDNERYLDVEKTNSLFEKYKFIYAKTLFKGSLSECLNYSNAFKSTLPKEFDLPELEGNICEGVVVRPVQPHFLKNGARVIIKNKNEKWAENNNYIDKALLKTIVRNEDEDLSEEASLLCEEIYKFITQNRLNNLISKVGEVDPKKDLGKIMGLYNKDVLTDFLKLYEARYQALEKNEMKAVNKFLNKYASQLIKECFDITEA